MAGLELTLQPRLDLRLRPPIHPPDVTDVGSACIVSALVISLVSCYSTAEGREGVHVSLLLILSVRRFDPSWLLLQILLS